MRPVTDPVEALAAEPERTLTFEAVFNFRDLGGYPAGEGRSVGWRRLFRADALHRLRPAEAEQVRRLGIATVIDLRTAEEVVNRGRFSAEVAHVDYHHLPIFDVMPDWPEDDTQSPGYLADRYAEMLETGRRSVATSLRLLAQRDAYPLVFHCAAGKDRTGLVSALVLSVCGVPDTSIVTDFAFTESRMPEIIARHTARAEQADADAEVAGQQYGAQAATMHAVLESLRDEHGSIEAYVRTTGLTDAEIDAMRAALVQSGA
jgi:protein tyrosine/serine phosphatase